MLAGFLLLAAVPSLLLTLVAVGAVRWAVDKIQSPSVEESFWSGAALSRELRGRLLHDASELLTVLPARAPDPDADTEVLSAALQRQNAAFMAWETPGAGTRAVEAADGGEGSGVPDANDWAALAESGAPPENRAGVIRIFAPADSSGPARAVGFRLDPATANAMDKAGRDYTRYRQLFLWEAVWKRVLFFALVAAFLATVGVAFAAARGTARRISRPVVQLAASADRLAAGDLSHRANIQAEGEIADLVRSFNGMSEQIEKSRDDLVRMERVAAWRDVARRVAHEIRNPLTPIRLALHRLKPRLPDDPATGECLGSIAEEIENLERLSTTFAEFAKLPDAAPAPTDLAHVAAGVVELQQGAAAGVVVEYAGPATLPLLADKDLLRRAATNLVKNAMEAVASRPGGGHVTVTVSVSAGTARLAVHDDGPGIPETLRETLGRPGVTTKASGSGLGLAMVQRIAADHRGRLSWASDAAGTTFALELPLAGGPATRTPAAGSSAS